MEKYAKCTNKIKDFTQRNKRVMNKPVPESLDSG